MTRKKNGYNTQDKFYSAALKMIQSKAVSEEYPYSPMNPTFMESWVNCMIDGQYGFAIDESNMNLYVTVKQPGKDQQQTYLLQRQSVLPGSPISTKTVSFKIRTPSYNSPEVEAQTIRSDNSIGV